MDQGTGLDVALAGARPRPLAGPAAWLKFDGDHAFQLALRRRVDEHFRASGRRQRDCPGMYAKSAILLAAFALSYSLLVFVAQAWWQALLLAVLLGLVSAAIGFNIEHDGSHQAFSARPWINRLAAMTLELLGGSSYFWRWKHGVFHHSYVNLAGHDPDIALGVLARLSPYQVWRTHHRWQHVYLWAFYALLPVKWHFIGDFRAFVTGRIGGQPVPRPRGGDLVSVVGGKAAFFAGAFVLPLILHPAWAVVGCYAVAALVAGIVLSVVFQMAHCVPEAQFPGPAGPGGRVARAWAVHQVETTVDFARNSRVASWLLGGLNFQIEHHLFPRICHVNYPALAGVVEQTCREFGIRYAAHRSCRAGLVSHYRWLRQMAMAPGPMRGALPRADLRSGGLSPGMQVRARADDGGETRAGTNPEQGGCRDE